MRKKQIHWVAGLVLLLGAPAAAEPPAGSPPNQAYFGELHLHTSLSTDAYMNGTRKHPVTAYRYAQGDPITLQSGQTWQLSKPLDKPRNRKTKSAY